VTPGHLAVACFVLAAVLTPFIWVGRRPVREWRLRWIDGRDPRRRRVCSGARSVVGRVRYAHYNADGDCLYVGKAIVFWRRMYQEGKENMSRELHTTIAERVPFWIPLVTAEAEWIDALHPTLNRNRGIRRLPWLARLTPWRY
jgi:hypothetical protein